MQQNTKKREVSASKLILLGPPLLQRNKLLTARAYRRKRDGTYHFIKANFPRDPHLQYPCCIMAEGGMLKPEGSYQMELYVKTFEVAEWEWRNEKEIEIAGKCYNLTKAQSIKLFNSEGPDGLLQGNLSTIQQVLGERAMAKAEMVTTNIEALLAKALGVSIRYAEAILRNYPRAAVLEEPYLLVAAGLNVAKLDTFCLLANLAPGNKYTHCGLQVREVAEQGGNYTFSKQVLFNAAKEVWGRAINDEEAAALLNVTNFTLLSNGTYIHNDTLANILFIKRHHKENVPQGCPTSPANGPTHTELWAAMQNSAMAILSGPAGSGKTTSIFALMEMLDELGVTYDLVATTGKAAIRARDVTGREASTLHMALARNKLSGEVIIVDEASMLDINLLATAIRAKPDAKWLFVGDDEQLPPIGPGMVYRELTHNTPGVRLTTIHRQLSDNPILGLATAIRIGKGVKQALCKVETKEMRDVEGIRNYLFSTFPHAQILTPTRNYKLGCKHLNEPWSIKNKTQSKGINAGTDTFNSFNSTFAVGDKVIHTSNIYDNAMSVFNGETGTVISANTNVMVVDFGRLKYKYDKYTSMFVEHSWAMTIHKSQGSEFDEVVLVIPHGLNHHFLSKQLLYTAVTRAKKRLVIVGDVGAITRPLRSIQHQQVWLKAK